MSNFNPTEFAERCKDPKANDNLIRTRIAEVITPKPWTHTIGNTLKPYFGDIQCCKCKKWFDSCPITPICPVPDPVTGSFADIAFELRDKVIGTNPNKYKIAVECLYAEYARKWNNPYDFNPWLLFRFTPLGIIQAALMSWPEETIDNKK